MKHENVERTLKIVMINKRGTKKLKPENLDFNSAIMARPVKFRYKNTCKSLEELDSTVHGIMSLHEV